MPKRQVPENSEISSIQQQQSPVEIGYTLPVGFSPPPIPDYADVNLWGTSKKQLQEIDEVAAEKIESRTQWVF